MERQRIAWNKDVYRDEYELEQLLLETFLLERRDGFLQNDISRRLFAIRLRFSNSDLFQKLCAEGLVVYGKHLNSPSLRRPETVAVEWLYQKLQYEYYVSNRRGNDLSECILQATDEVLDKLVSNWDHREIVPDFIETLRADWELEFNLNYMSSREGYSHDPFREVLRRAEEKRKQLLQGANSDE
jgi:hypothetical protein